MKWNDYYRRLYVLGVVLLLWLSLIATVLFSAPHAAAQAPNGITEPTDGGVLSGVVIVRGTATDPAFLRYELSFSRGGDWIVFGEGSQPVVNNTLAIWDTTVGQPANPVFPDGTYHLRLRVVRQDYNYDEYFVRNLTVMNSLTPTPTETSTSPSSGTPRPAPATATPGEGTPETESLDPDRPTPLPSLTPFDLPTAIPTLAGNVITAGIRIETGGEDVAENDGLLQRLTSIDTTRFMQAFWQGARLGAYLIAVLPLYVVLRMVGRRLWRLVIKRWWN